MLYAVRQKEQHKFTGTKVAHKMMMKLTLARDKKRRNEIRR